MGELKRPAVWYSWDAGTIYHLLSPRTNVAVCGVKAGTLDRWPMFMSQDMHLCDGCMANASSVDAPEIR